MNVLDLLRRRVEQRQTSHMEQLVDAARAIAAGRSVDTEAVDAAMNSAGVTFDQFEQLVATARRRFDWHKQAKNLPAARKAHERIQATADKERQAFEETQRAWAERAKQLDAEHRQARKDLDTAEAAAGHLVDPDNVLGAAGDRLREAHVEHDEAAATHGGLVRAVKETKEKIAYEKTWIEQKQAVNVEGLSVEDHRRFLRRAEARLAEHQAELKNAEAALAKATKNLEAATAAALDS